jgi:hypothetical protein
MLIGLFVLSFDAGDMPSPLCVMEGRKRKGKIWWKMLRDG